KVTVDVITHYGSNQQTSERQQIPLNEKNALVTFNLIDGRRKEALADAQVENVAQIQNAANRALLAQQLAGVGNNGAAQSFGAALAGNGLAGLGPFGFFRLGAVGYRPIIQNFPTGANFNTNAVISADRRYVRVSPTPFFSQITEVNTFNFVSGMGGTQSEG